MNATPERSTPTRMPGLPGWSIPALAALLLSSTTCSPRSDAVEPADLVLLNGRIYTLAWNDPDGEGTPAPDAPFDPASGWRPDATALAVRSDTIVYVGDDEGARALVGQGTRILDMAGATAVPGLVDSHTHVVQLGETLSRVDLVGVTTEQEAVERVARWAASVPAGTWIVGHGWDEGAWANRYPDGSLLSQRVPDHPVFLRGLHGFAGWGNRLALERAGIAADTPDPVGGEIRKGPDGDPTGLLLNRAVALLENALPTPDRAELKRRILAGLEAMAEAGYVGIHEAGVDAATLAAFQELEDEGQLPLRVYAMLSARDAALLDEWRARGPDTDVGSMLRTRSVKAFYDGALGSRGARLLDDYTDQPGHRGLSGNAYGFDQERVRQMMAAGFQVAIHAIGDGGNRETLDFIEDVLAGIPASRSARHRVEHAQVVHADDFSRFRALDLIASMEPPHAVEDMAWAEDRLGPVRVRGAYAWRTMRREGVRLVFNSDLPGSDHDIFYGLHAAITRRGPDMEPSGGWYPEERVTPEEALRAYSSWAAYAGFAEERTGVLVPGKWADITVLDIDPLALGTTNPGALLQGKILATIVGGVVRHESIADGNGG